LALRTKQTRDFHGHVNSPLPGAPGQLFRLQLGENFRQGKFDLRLVLVAELREHTGWGSLAEFTEGNPHSTVLQLRQDFLEWNGNLYSANRRLAYPAPQRVG
jgi:hypothetical protein